MSDLAEGAGGQQGQEVSWGLTKSALLLQQQGWGVMAPRGGLRGVLSITYQSDRTLSRPVEMCPSGL